MKAPVIQGNTSVISPNASPGGPVARQGGGSALGKSLTDLAFTIERARRAKDAGQAEVESIQGLNDLASELDQINDPDQLPSLFEERSEELKANISTRFKRQDEVDTFNRRFSLRAERLRVNVDRRRTQLLVDQSRAALDQTSFELIQLASRAESGGETQGHFTAFDELVQRNVDAGVITAEDGGNRSRKFRAETESAQALTILNADPEAALALFQDPDNFPNLAVDDLLRLENAAKNEIIQRQREATAQAREAAAEARLILADLNQDLAQNIPLNQKDLERAQTAILASQNPDLAERYDEVLRLSGYQGALLQASPIEVQNEINRLANQARGANPTGFEAEQLELARSVQTNMNRELINDPLSFASQTGAIKDENGETIQLPPLDFSPGNRAFSFSERARIASDVSARFGSAPKFFTGEEKTFLQNRIAEADGAELTALAVDFGRGFGQFSPQAAAEISDQAPQFAHMAQLLARGPRQFLQTANDIADGIVAIRDKGAQVPGASDVEEVAQEILGNALFGNNAGARNQVIETAKAIYVARAARRGITSSGDDFFDAELFADSLRAATGQVGEFGGIGEHNGSNFIIPTNMTGDQIDDFLDKVKTEDFVGFSLGGGIPVHGNRAGNFDPKGEKFQASELDGAFLVSTPGGYFISMSNPAIGVEPVFDKLTEQPFILTFEGGRTAGVLQFVFERRRREKTFLQIGKKPGLL